MKKAFVSGMVQGVLFREGAKRKADELGIFGWVRNLDDGRVELAIGGDRADEMIDWIGEGPPAADVRKVEVADISGSGEVEEFEIKR